jgi:hypothetical protein
MEGLNEREIRFLYAGLAVVSIEIAHFVVEAEVAVFHTIRVEHGYDLEDKHLAKDGGCSAISQQKLYDSLDEEGR